MKYTYLLGIILVLGILLYMLRNLIILGLLVVTLVYFVGKYLNEQK